MDNKQKIELIKRNTAEIITEEELKKLFEKKKSPTVYLGVSITGKPHIGYFVWVTKIGDFIKAGLNVKILLADLHGALDNTPWELLDKRYQYYKTIIPLLFEAVGADLKKLKIIKGSDFQLDKKYLFDVLKMSTKATVHDCTKAASEVVKMRKSPKLSGLIYPIMQSIDEQYLEADIQYGGTDQRKILVFAREHLPKIGYKRHVEIMSPLIPGLTASGKMSSSEAGSKIDILDDEKTVERKINSAYCEPGDVKNGVLAFVKYAIMPLKQDKKAKFIIERPEKFGGNVEYEEYKTLEKDYAIKKLHPQDLKKAVAKEVNKLLNSVRKGAVSVQKILKQAYPKL